MWVVRVETQLSDHGTQSVRNYECNRCGGRRSLWTRSAL
jgi:hypothetical protein